MIFATVFTLLAAVWATFVTSAVLQSAAGAVNGGIGIVAFDRPIYMPATMEDEILLLCAASASAALALVTGVYMIRGRRLERRMAAELDDRMATRIQRDAGDSAVSRLLESRVDELQTSVDTLTAQRDAIYDEIRELRAAREAGQVNVIAIPEVGPGSEEPADDEAPSADVAQLPERAG